MYTCALCCSQVSTVCAVGTNNIDAMSTIILSFQFVFSYCHWCCLLLLKGWWCCTYHDIHRISFQLDSCSSSNEMRNISLLRLEANKLILFLFFFFCLTINANWHNTARTFWHGIYWCESLVVNWVNACIHLIGFTVPLEREKEKRKIKWIKNRTVKSQTFKKKNFFSSPCFFFKKVYI